MTWQSVLNAIDAVESWIVLLPLYAQIPLMLVVFVPITWFLARAIDRVVEWLLRPHTAHRERARDAG